MSFGRVRAEVARYYAGKLAQYGPTPRGVDWSSAESQSLRFERLLSIVAARGPFTLNDYGCGYGALVEHLERRGLGFRYAGYDVSPELLAAAQARFAGRTDLAFVADESLLRPADYTLASGIFNVRLSFGDDEWRAYLLATLDCLAELSTKGFAFNALTRYSDPERMRPDLYYADPTFLFDHCKRHYSRFVALLHDYPLWEFTILVRKAEAP